MDGGRGHLEVVASPAVLDEDAVLGLHAGMVVRALDPTVLLRLEGACWWREKGVPEMACDLGIG